MDREISDDPIVEYLNQLSLEALNSLSIELEKFVENKARSQQTPQESARPKPAGSVNKSSIGFPPVFSNSVAKMAEEAGLDLSSLMKDIARRAR